MNKLKTGLAIAVMGLITLNIHSCNSTPSEEHSMETPVSNEGTYACPMHPEIIGEAGDACSICGMDLTASEGEYPSGHDH